MGGGVKVRNTVALVGRLYSESVEEEEEERWRKQKREPAVNEIFMRAVMLPGTLLHGDEMSCRFESLQKPWGGFLFAPSCPTNKTGSNVYESMWRAHFCN